MDPANKAPPSEPAVLGADPADVPRYSQREMDAAAASIRKGVEKKLGERVAALEERFGAQPSAAPAAASAPESMPAWLQPLIDAVVANKERPAPGVAPPPVHQSPAPGAAPVAAAPAPGKPLTLAAALASLQPGAPAGPPPPAPAPHPLPDLDRAMVHPNKLTADQVARLGPKGTLDYVNKYFRDRDGGQ